MKRGSRGLSASAMRRSLMAVFSTESLTNWWPHASSSLVSRDPSRRASQQRSRLARQRAQQVEGSGRERDSLPIAQQARIRLVEVKLVEADPNRIRDGLRACHALRRAMGPDRIIAGPSAIAGCVQRKVLANQTTARSDRRVR